VKLNNKTIRNYLLYSSGIFLLTIPVFYFVLQQVLLGSVDHALRIQFHEIRERVGEIGSDAELTAWTKMDKDITLVPADTPVPDAIYTIDRFNRKHHESEPFREMSGTLTVIGRLYRLTISSSLIENDDLLGSILLLQVSVLLVLIGGMLWINQKMSKRLWQPFYVALQNMRQYEVNKQPDLGFRPSTTDEFNELNKAIEHLFSRSHDLFLQQREFTENAAHEMQTPVAIFQSKLELLMQTSPLNLEQAQLIQTLDATTRRIIRLNKSLLLLAKIENHQYTTTEQIDITALCIKLIDQLDLQAAAKDLAIETSWESAIRVEANPVLLDILVGNLLSNAIRHNCDHGAIRIGTYASALVISNTGDNTPLQPSRIFDRFHKQTKRTGGEDSTGLGLAIVKNICALYRYDIEYSFSKGWHSFKIDFSEKAAEPL
jgi:two-component system sensor histidine kinase ArlS